MSQFTQQPTPAPQGALPVPVQPHAPTVGPPWTDLAPTQEYQGEVPTEVVPMATDTPASLQESTPQGEVITFRPYQDLPPPQEHQ
eukprot:6323209-Amphidinium_carterae.1